MYRLFGLIALTAAASIGGILASVPGSPGAGADAASTAIAWAQGYLGQDFDNGLCLQFVGSAYADAGINIGTADTAADYWTDNPEGYAENPGNTSPPIGALVFWGPDDVDGYSNPAGHVGIYVGSVSGVGSDEVISTWSWPEPESQPDVHYFSLSGRNAAGYPYLGWMAPAGGSSGGGSPPPAPATGTDLVENGGFNVGTADWDVGSGTNFAVYSNGQVAGTNAYEGSAFGATNAPSQGASIYQDIPMTITAGESFCVSAEMVTAGETSGGGANLAIWLIGGSGNENGVYTFSNLPGGNAWTPGSACVTATGAHTDLRIQIYPDYNGPTVAFDAVDAHPDLVENGGFNVGTADWDVGSGTNFAVYSNGQVAGTNAYEGSAFGATNAPSQGASIYQDIPMTITAGESFCVSAEMVTAGETSGGGANLAIWLIGGSGNENGVYTFSNLPGGNAWTPGSACVTATGAHTDLRIQIYPDYNGPTVAFDAVDAHPDLVENGGFNVGTADWDVGSGTNFAVYSNGQVAGTNAYEGSAFGATNAPSQGASIYQDIPMTITAGESFCVSAEMVTAGETSGGGANLAIWLIGGSGNENGVYTFSNLPGGNAWTPGSACVTATGAHTDLRIQIYPDYNGPTVAFDAVDTQAKGFGASYQPPTIATTSIQNGFVGVPYSVPLNVKSGVGPYTWSLSSGSLPEGLTLSSAGLISGTPTSACACSFNAQVADAGYETATKSFTLTVNPASSTGGGGGGGSSPQPVTSSSSTSGHGYWLVGSDGGIFSFGSANFYGSTGSLKLQRPVVGIVPTKDDGGYWLDASDGGVFSFGDTQFYGSIPGLGLHPAGSGLPNSLNAPIVGMVPSIDDGGYFMVASDGGVFAFGDAHFAGSCPGIGGCSGAAVAVMPDASGNGYWLVTSTGNVYTFGDAPNYGAPGQGTVSSAVATPDGKGYWVLLSDGEVFAYGDAASDGDAAGAFGGFNPATAIFTTSDGGGYWIASANGTVDNYGDAPNDGGMAGTPLNGSIIAATGF